MRKLAGSKYRVVNTDTGAVKAKRTTKRKAEAQLRVLKQAEGPAKPRRKRRRAKSRR